MDWFRMYNEFARDPKLATLSKSQRYDVVCLLCLASESEVRGRIFLDNEDLAAYLGITEDEWAAFERKLTKKEMVHRAETGELVVTNWTKRQYQSDSSTERVRKHRAERLASVPITVPKQNETLQERYCNATITDTEQSHRESRDSVAPTASDADVALFDDEDEVPTDPHSEADSVTPRRKSYPADFEVFWSAYPPRAGQKRGKGNAAKQWAQAKRREDPQRIMEALERWKRCPDWTKDGGAYIMDAERWLRHAHWEDEIETRDAMLTSPGTNGAMPRNGVLEYCTAARYGIARGSS